MGPPDAPHEPAASAPRQPHQQHAAPVGRGGPALLWISIGYAIAIATAFLGDGAVLFSVILWVIVGPASGGLFVVQPNEGQVLVLFGRYIGSVTEAGLWWRNPFAKRRTVSLRVRNFQTERLKVNDASGNPIEIAAVVVWCVSDTAKAVFDVDDYEEFVTVQSESALRHLAGRYPYDDYAPDSTSLRAHGEEVHVSLQSELQDRLRVAGIEVIEARLTHLAYAPEVATLMLRRQQAEAVLAARRVIVQGVTRMVQAAVGQLGDSELIELEPERQAAMVSNLLVALAGDRAPTPVITASSLYT
jgi:regulator of protease activity HflC (stomatin/prohibitin superfamily)